MAFLLPWSCRFQFLSPRLCLGLFCLASTVPWLTFRGLPAEGLGVLLPEAASCKAHLDVASKVLELLPQEGLSWAAHGTSNPRARLSEDPLRVSSPAPFLRKRSPAPLLGGSSECSSWLRDDRPSRWASRRPSSCLATLPCWGSPLAVAVLGPQESCERPRSRADVFSALLFPPA